VRTRNSILGYCAAMSLVSVALAAPIDVNVKTAGELSDACAANPKDPAGQALINYCIGYGQGAVAAVLQRPEDKKLFCISTPPPQRIVTMREFASWVRAIPTRRSEPAEEGFLHFMAERFPCKS
jgi:hypothetical protein